MPMKWYPQFKHDLKDNFISYLRGQKLLLIVAGCLSVVLYPLLRYCYPLPDLFVDSVNYVLWAQYDLPVAYRPVGYSVFLQLVHGVSESGGAVVFAQYLLFVLSSVFFFFSVDYLFGLSKKLALPILVVVLCNPILLFQSNLISSDSLFCSLTVVWLTTCLWIVKRPGWWALIAQLLFLYLAFRVRYTAMFFPVVAIVAFIVCTAKMGYKLIGTGLTIAVISLTVWQQKKATLQYTNTDVFSGFAGWQIANNALYCYPYISLQREDLPNREMQIVDFSVRKYLDSVKKGDGVGYVYLWDTRSPLKKYLNLCSNRNHTDYLISWFNASVTLNDYGWYIVQHYPGTFVRHFIVPNSLNYFYPATEVLGNYDYTNIKIPAETMAWFGFGSEHLDCTYPVLQSTIIGVYPALSLLLNLLNIAAILFFLVRVVPVWKSVSQEDKGLLVVWGLFFTGYMAFSIFASAVNLRFLDYLFVTGYIMPFVLFAKARKMRVKPAQR